MPDASRDQLLHLLQRALELPAAARKLFLDSKCGGDVELEQRLLAMLAAADAPSAAVSAAPIAPPPAPAKPSTRGDGEALREAPGSHIGPYKLLQLIGEGGFGAVFLAEQEQPVVRKVALKIIKLGMDTRQVVARFEQERQALAMMDHPNIARVLDAGATATGRPYFVMDLVKGDPIADYCDKNNLPIEERLELFAQVCNAVQHAHGKGIIHRDIKPSNILVGTQDGRAVAKVIDFGIAKATSSKLTDKTLFTEQQQVIGTLQYMSPEQAEGSLDIDTRTDVYSLGVLLYELLTGSTPFDNKTIRGAVFGELQRMIREVEPPKPSTRLHQSTDTLASIAAHRRTEPRRLGSLVRGELDWIVMKSLEKDRSRRYETANGLAMDVRRYLAGEAVVAAPPGAGYRLRKFVRRNRGKVAAAAAVGVALLAGVVAFAWQADIAQHERDDAVLARQQEAEARGKADQLAAAEGQQRQIAQSNERKAEAINQFLLDMLGSANIRELGRDAKVAQALDRAAATTDKAFADRPEVEAAVHQILGRTYLSLGMLDEAAPQMQAAREYHRRTGGEQSLEYGRDLRDLGTWQQQKGEQAASADTFTRAIAIVAAADSPDSELAIDLQVDYANVLVDLHREAEAEKLLRAALSLRTGKFGRAAVNTQVAINSLAVLLHKLERLDEAEPLYREALELGERTLGAEHPDTITVRFNLASILRSRGNLVEAEPLMRAAYASTKKVFGDWNPKTGTGALVLARLYAAQGRYKDALPLRQECVAIRIHNEGARSAAVAVAKSELAENFRMLGEAASAVPLLRDTVDIDIAVLGAEDRETLGARLDLANTLARTDAKAEAEAMLRELLQTCPRVLGPDNPLSIIVINSYGVLLLGQERYADAEPLVKQALDAGVRVQGADHKNTLVTQLNYAAVTRELGRLDEAEAIGRDAIGRVARVYGAQHPYTSGAYRSHAETLIRLGRGDEARPQLVDAIAIDKAATGAGNPTFANAALVLARLQLDTGHLDEAEAVLADIVAAYTSSGHAEHRHVVNARIELGRCRWLQARFAEAEPLLLDGEKALVALLPVGKRDVQRSEGYLAAFYAAWNQAAPEAGRAGKATEWQQKAAAH